MDPRLIHRTRAPHERPREYNDPSKQDQPSAYYHRTRTQRIVAFLGAAVMLIIGGGILAGIAFVVFNLLSN